MLRRVLVWMDLEMTGLDPARHRIVEVATLLTDDDLEIVAEGPDLVVHADDEALSAMDEVVLNMHTRSGLLDAIRASSVTLEEAGQLTLQFLRDHVPEGKVPLCGNSIGTDRRFLAVQLPQVEAWLHYRCVDVSTLKELARRWYPPALSSAPRKAAGHRALDDIRESVAELRHYRAALFRQEAGGEAGDGSGHPSGRDAAALPAHGPAQQDQPDRGEEQRGEHQRVDREQSPRGPAEGADPPAEPPQLGGVGD